VAGHKTFIYQHNSSTAPKKMWTKAIGLIGGILQSEAVHWLTRGGHLKSGKGGANTERANNKSWLKKQTSFIYEGVPESNPRLTRIFF